MTPDRLREITRAWLETGHDGLLHVSRADTEQACRALLAAIDVMQARTEREYAEATDRYRAALHCICGAPYEAGKEG